MKSESCESKVSNLLASIENLPNAEKWSRGFDILVQCLQFREGEIAELKEANGHLKKEVSEVVLGMRGMQAEIELLRKWNAELEQKVADVPKISVGEDWTTQEDATRLEMHVMGENYVWFRAVSKDGRKWDTLPLKGEV